MRQKNLILDVVLLMLSFVSLTYFSKLPETKLERRPVCSLFLPARHNFWCMESSCFAVVVAAERHYNSSAYSVPSPQLKEKEEEKTHTAAAALR